MEAKEFIIHTIATKLRRERGLSIVREDFRGKRPDGVIKSSNTVLGVMLSFLDEPWSEMEKRIKEFLELDATVYILVQKGRRKEVTDRLWKSSLLNRVKLITWDMVVGF